MSLSTAAVSSRPVSTVHETVHSYAHKASLIGGGITLASYLIPQLNNYFKYFAAFTAVVTAATYFTRKTVTAEQNAKSAKIEDPKLILTEETYVATVADLAKNDFSKLDLAGLKKAVMYHNALKRAFQNFSAEFRADHTEQNGQVLAIGKILATILKPIKETQAQKVRFLGSGRYQFGNNLILKCPPFFNPFNNLPRYHLSPSDVGRMTFRGIRDLDSIKTEIKFQPGDVFAWATTVGCVRNDPTFDPSFLSSLNKDVKFLYLGNVKGAEGAPYSSSTSYELYFYGHPGTVGETPKRIMKQEEYSAKVADFLKIDFNKLNNAGLKKAWLDYKVLRDASPELSSEFRDSHPEQADQLNEMRETLVTMLKQIKEAQAKKQS